MRARNRMAAAVGAASLVTAGLVTLPTAASASAPRWVATATRGLAPAKTVKVGGAVTGSKRMTTEVGLRLRNVAVLKRDIARHDVLTRAQFQRSFAPTAKQVARVESYLRSA